MFTLQMIKYNAMSAAMGQAFPFDVHQMTTAYISLEMAVMAAADLVRSVPCYVGAEIGNGGSVLAMGLDYGKGTGAPAGNGLTWAFN